MIRILLKPAFFFLLLAQCSFTAPTPTNILQRVAVTGASVSAGYGLKTPPTKGNLAAYPMDFTHVMDAMITVPHDAVGDFCDLMFFRSSRKNAAEYIQQIVAYKPTLVVGIDFLFWFGYGSVPDGIAEEEHRMEKLEFALDLLDTLEVPLLIGDLPDVREAVGRLLSQSQVPSEEILHSLNNRIHTWIDSKENATLLPVHEYWKLMMQDKEITVLGTTWPEGTKDRLLQKDSLHMTREGTVVSGLLVAEIIGGDDFETDATVILLKAAALARAK